MNQDVVRELGRRCPEQKIATLDVDATLIESWKREAKLTYEGYTGNQPLPALWAEINLVVADEFRDGNGGGECWERPHDPEDAQAVVA